MKDFIPITTPPPAPGRYWTRTDLKTWTTPDGVKHINYRQDWAYWNGDTWEGGSPDFWYGEKTLVLAAQK